MHGLSRVFDPRAHAWRDRGWTGRQLAGGVVYELHIGTFTPEGTLDAAIGRLDHLVDLGVDFVEVLPVNAFNGEWNWGYDGVLWYAVQESYGGPAAYQRFVDACHQRGLAVIQDVVYNHLGPSGNYLPEFGPYLHEGRANTWGASLNLDGPDSDVVREHIIRNALMWLDDYRVDGLRLDAVHALVDHRAVHLLEELAERVDALSAHVGRPLTLIAESDLNDPRMIRPREAHGYGITAQWSDDFHHAVHVAVSGETAGYYEDFAPLTALRDVLERGFFHARTHVDASAAGCTVARSTWSARPPGGSSCSTRTTTRSATAPRATGSRHPSTTAASRSPRRSPCSRRSRRCCSWARSGRPRRRGSSSPRIPNPSSGARRPKGASRSSRAWAGTPLSCPTRRTPRRSGARSSTGPSRTPRRTSTRVRR